MWLRILLPGLIALGALGALGAAAALADSPPDSRAATTLEALPPGEGEHSVVLSARLMDANGAPVGGERLSFYVVTEVFGERLMKVGEQTTDATGTAWTMYEQRGEGPQKAVVRYDGSGGYAPAQTGITFSAKGLPVLHENAKFGLEPVRAWLPAAVGLVVLAVWGVLGLVVFRTFILIPAAASPRTSPFPVLPTLKPASLAPRLAFATAALALATVGAWMLLQQRNQEQASLGEVRLEAGGEAAQQSLAYSLVGSHPLAGDSGAIQDSNPDVATDGRHAFALAQGQVVAITGDAASDHAALGVNGAAWLPGTTAIALHDGSLYAANAVTGDISVLSPSGQLDRLVRPLIPPGNRPLRPVALAVTERGNIWLSDTENRRVFLFGEDGTLLRAIGDAAQSADDYVFGLPAGLALDEAENLYVVDAGQAVVKKYSSLGVFLGTIGATEGAPGRLASPRDVAVDETGAVFVSDTESGVQVFAADGTYKGRLSEGEPGGPAGAYAVSAAGGRLYLIDGASELAVLKPGEIALHHGN